MDLIQQREDIPAFIFQECHCLSQDALQLISQNQFVNVYGYDCTIKQIHQPTASLQEDF